MLISSYITFPYSYYTLFQFIGDIDNLLCFILFSINYKLSTIPFSVIQTPHAHHPTWFQMTLYSRLFLFIVDLWKKSPTWNILALHCTYSKPNGPFQYSRTIMVIFIISWHLSPFIISVWQGLPFTKSLILLSHKLFQSIYSVLGTMLENLDLCLSEWSLALRNFQSREERYKLTLIWRQCNCVIL